MQQIWFDVMQEREAWVVRCCSKSLGRFRTQHEAFSVAVAEARKIKDTGGAMVQVRVLRDACAPDRCVNLLSG